MHCYNQEKNARQFNNTCNFWLFRKEQNETVTEFGKTPARFASSRGTTWQARARDCCTWKWGRDIWWYFECSVLWWTRGHKISIIGDWSLRPRMKGYWQANQVTLPNQRSLDIDTIQLLEWTCTGDHWGTSSKFCMIWPHDIVDIVDSESWRSAVQRKIHRINSCPTKCLNLVWPHGKVTPAAATPESPATQTETAPDTPSDHLRAVGQKGTSKFLFKHS